MLWTELEHVLGAAANVVGEDEFVVIGSQAILGSHPDAPAQLLRSMEADIYPASAPERADEVDGALGDGSQFHRTFGYYAHGVGPETAVAPAGCATGWFASRSALDLARSDGLSRSASSRTTSSSQSASPVASATGSSHAMRCGRGS